MNGGFQSRDRTDGRCDGHETRQACEADYIVVEIAQHILGEQWLRDYVAAANDGGIERVLL